MDGDALSPEEKAAGREKLMLHIEELLGTIEGNAAFVHELGQDPGVQEFRRLAGEKKSVKLSQFLEEQAPRFVVYDAEVNGKMCRCVALP